MNLTGRLRAVGLLALLLLITMVSTPCASAITVRRGPYLQQGTTNGVVVRWRTDFPTDSFVRYGLDAESLTGLVSQTEAVTDHIVQIAGLEPDTKYFYQIGTATDWFPAGTNHYFATFPLVGVPKPTHIWVLGDCGAASVEQMMVTEGYKRFNRDRRIDLWIMLGDNAYDEGWDIEYQYSVFNMYPNFLRNTILFSAIGNHETYSMSTNGSLAYFDIFTLPQNGEAGGIPSGTERYYSFDYANIHFVCLDSMISDRSSDGAMCQWLRQDLLANSQEWLIAFWHHPPYSKGSHDSDSEIELLEMRQNVLPILEDFGVDLVLCGHSHSYERSFLLDGHYGPSTTLDLSMKTNGGDGRPDGSGPFIKPAGASPHHGTVYTVAGSSSLVSGGPLNHPAMFISLNSLGSLNIDVDAHRLDLSFIQTNGVAGDYFTLLKQDTVTNVPTDSIPPAAVTNLFVADVSTNSIMLLWTAPGDDGDTGTATYYDLRYSTSVITEASWPLATPVIGMKPPAIAGAQEVCIVTGLLAGATYYFGLKAADETNNIGPLSNVADGTTLTPPIVDISPPAAITNLAVIGVTTGSITLVWTAPGDDGNVGTAALYDLRSSDSSISEANWPSCLQAAGVPPPAPPDSLQTFTVTGLLSGVTYYFGLKTADKTNNLSLLSNIASATTALPPTPPARPTRLRLMPAGTNAIYLAWIDNANNEDGFKVERSSNGVSFAQISAVGSNVTSLVDRTIRPGSTNYYRVRAYNIAGDSPYSNTNSATANPLPSSLLSTLTPSNSVWKYLDDGSNQSNAWSALTYNDSTWASGPAILGYNGGHESTIVSYGANASAKYITTYFRRHFLVGDPSTIGSLTVSLLRDDGGVVYLNGVEVFRDNMPTGAVNYLGIAPISVSGTDKTSFHPSPPINPSMLVPGDNVVAVELHQHGGSSTSMDFDLQVFSTNKLAPTSTSLSSALNPSLSGASITITATVSNVLHGAQIGMGTVTFAEGSNVLAVAVPLNSNGQATFTANSLAEGTHTISGTYQGMAGTFTPSTGSLIVNVCAPLALAPLVNQSACAGAAAAFTYMSTGGAPLTVVWKQGSKALTSGVSLGGRVVMTNNDAGGVLSIANLQSSDSGLYTVQITDACGSTVSSSASLVVNALPAPPLIGLSPARPCVGSTGNQAFGPINATTYEWTITNGNITSASNVPTITYAAGPSGTVGLTLKVSNISGCTMDNSTNVMLFPASLLSCPNNLIVIAPGNCATVVHFELPSGDPCSPVPMSANPPSGSAFPPGTNTVVVSAVDILGQASSCAFQVTVVPGPPPALTIVPQGPNLLLAWPEGAGCCTLQFSSSPLSLASEAVWLPFPGPLQTNGGFIFATNTPVSTNLFFRLAY